MPPETPDADGQEEESSGEQGWFDRGWADHLRTRGDPDRPCCRLSVLDDDDRGRRFFEPADPAWPPQMVAIEVDIGRETVDTGRIPVRLVVDRRGHDVDPAVVDHVADRMVDYVRGKPVQYLDINVNSVRGPLDVGSDRVTIAEVTYRFEPGDEQGCFEAISRGLDEFAELYAIALDTRPDSVAR